MHAPIRSIRGLAALALSLALAAPALASAQQRDRQSERQRETNAFQWSGRIPSGSWLRVRNINGPIRVVAATGDNAEVTADKTWRTGNAQQVRVEMVRDGNNVTICAIWHPNVRCDAEGYHGSGRSENSGDVAVEFTVRLPRGVHLNGNTVNGSFTVEGATGQVVARTINGDVNVSSSGGPVEARTTNGSIDASMGTATLSDDLSFITTNGSITLTLPAAINARLEMRTVNGRLTSDFPLTLSGPISPRQISTTLGSGGRRLELRTVNGSVTIKRS